MCRGQAQCKLGDGLAAIKDLKRALVLSPESEKGTIREKLIEAEQLERHATRGTSVEKYQLPYITLNSYCDIFRICSNGAVSSGPTHF